MKSLLVGSRMFASWSGKIDLSILKQPIFFADESHDFKARKILDFIH